MKISTIIATLELFAPSGLQESYDNAGLLTGRPDWNCTGVLCTLDVTEQLIEEAERLQCNLIVAHHPIIFGAIKSITGKNYVERILIQAIKKDIAIFAIHTNLDNIIDGVNGKIADKLGLQNGKILAPKFDILKRLYCFVPEAYADRVKQAVFEAGAGHIGNYSECSFASEGIGTYLPGAGAHPFIGNAGEQQKTKELKIEIIYPQWLEAHIIAAMKAAHPYEEVAYDCIALTNANQYTGSGLVGELRQAISEFDFLAEVKKIFGLKLIRHTAFLKKPIKKVAVCGGAGSFLIFNALQAEADAFITADLKYHEFFNADGRLLLADIGHYESEQFTAELICEFLQKKFPNFAVLKTAVATNPVHYC